MYCDFCGIKLPYNVKYCRHCGRQLRDRSGDTQPLPVIDEALLNRTNGQMLGAEPWYKWPFKKKTLANGPKVRKILYYIFSLTTITAVIYILATFKTIKEYQALLAILGGLLAIYIWWKR